MKTILIDGENYRHQIASILVSAGKLPKEQANDFFKFDSKAFIADITETEPSELTIFYYTTRIKTPLFSIPQKLTKSLDAIAKANRQWLSGLANQDIKVIKAGNLQVRQSNSCVHCSKKTLVLQEKGVDVRVSLDLLKLAQAGEDVYLFSSDSDITPALTAANQYKQKVIYICPGDTVNRAIVAQTNKVITFDNKDVLRYFKD